MTEWEWCQCADPIRLLAYLNRPQGDRKLLLYAVACCREHQHHLRHAVSRDAIEWAARFADGDVDRDEESHRLEWASEGAAYECETSLAREHVADWVESGARESGASLRHLHGRIAARRHSATHAAYFANALLSLDTTDPFDPTLSRHERLLSVEPLRDIFGNPFRPVACDPAWRTDTAVSLATQMYETREFGAMPILADALQDAGCDNPDILNHCRDTSLPHVRGCWVIDLLTGRG